MSIKLDNLTATEILPPTTGEEVAGYVALPLCHIEGGGPIPFEVYLKVKAKDSSELKFLILNSRNEFLSQEWSEKLADLKVSYVYFLPREQKQVLQYLLAQTNAMLADNSRHNTAKAKMLSDAAHIWMRHFFTNELDHTGEQLDLAQHFIGGLYESMRHDPAQIHSLRQMQEIEDTLYHHSLQVCILGLAFVSYLGWAPRDAEAFGVGALLHDVGMTQISRSCWTKGRLPDADDKREMARHPLLGERMLRNFTSIRREALLMVAQHHENGDGSGYPRGLRLEAIHPWAQILHILNDYDNLTTARSGSPVYTPQEAVWNMRHEQKRRIYHPEYFKVFIKFLAGI